jgi:hypothetical protein
MAVHSKLNHHDHNQIQRQCKKNYRTNEREKCLLNSDKPTILHEKRRRRQRANWVSTQIKDMAGTIENFLEDSGGQIDTSCRVYQGCLTARRFVCNLLRVCNAQLYYSCGYHRPNPDFTEQCKDLFSQFSMIARQKPEYGNPVYRLLVALLEECKKARQQHKARKHDVHQIVCGCLASRHLSCNVLVLTFITPETPHRPDTPRKATQECEDQREI